MADQARQRKRKPATAIAHALNAYFLCYWDTTQRPFDPVDAVVLQYPPLAHEPYYALQFHNQGVPMASCAESVQTLALWLAWADANKDKEEEKQTQHPRMLDVMAPHGLTVVQMRRRMQRLRLEHFPIYEFDGATGRFTLLSGKPREDLMAIVFLPQDPPQLPQAHWTFGAVIHEADPEPLAHLPNVQFGGGVSYTIYSRLPIEDPVIYWRAEVSPENYDAYVHQRTLAPNRVCDCDWRFDCSHEREFHTLAQQVQKITLDGERHVFGSWRAILKRTRGLPCFRDSSSSMIVKLGGHQMRFDGMACDLALEAKSIFYKMFTVRTTNKLLEQRELGIFDVDCYTIHCFQIVDESALLRMALPTPRTVALAIAAATESQLLRRVARVRWVVPEKPWAAMEDLQLRLPRKSELLARLAVRDELTKANVIDTVRRMAAEEHWDIDVERSEFHLWLTRIVEEKATMMIPAVSVDRCWCCCLKKSTHRHMCKDCKRKSRDAPPPPIPLSDVFVTYVGYRALWSKEFTLPKFELKANVEVRLRKSKRIIVSTIAGKERHSLHDALAYLTARKTPVSCRGYLRGPMFLGQTATCFPSGDAIAVMTFLVRLGAKRKHIAQQWFYNLCYDFIAPLLQEIAPESWDYFLAHLRGVKKQMALEARQQVNEGWAPAEDHGRVRVRMSGFVKVEKSYSTEYSKDYFLKDKPSEKPRFICSPDPIILVRLGPWTHAQTKWLAKRFPWHKTMFYAGCSNPEELHSWLNASIASIPEPWTLVDDITAIDANHSSESFRWHARIRQVQFPRISDWMEATYRSEEDLSVRVGLYKCSVESVNASGVSDTSYKNSMICLAVRSVSVLHGFADITKMSDSEFLSRMELMRPQFWAAASGDDGLVRLPERLLEYSIHDFSIARYQQAWSWAGFEVKVQLLPPHRWRMATFLAMRPVWAGTRYEWAPEPARRLRGMFWQLENAMHPTAWARGVASQVLLQAKPVPVLSHICRWFMARTRGPVAEVQLMHEYNPFNGLTSSGDYNERAETEFCVDYNVKKGDIERLEAMLAQLDTVLVNLDCFVLQRVFAEES